VESEPTDTNTGQHLWLLLLESGPRPGSKCDAHSDWYHVGLSIIDGSGNYTFSSLTSGASYTVTPNKAARAPGSTGIDTVDVIATQRHFLVLGTPLSGCRLTAAEVNGDSAVNTVDVLAIQRFFLGRTFGTANVGSYQFSPASRSYPAVGSNQTGQNYDTLTFGDVASPFVGP
jgi:hypothetical protein